mgnify:CR=1 FL=1
MSRWTNSQKKRSKRQTIINRDGNCCRLCHTPFSNSCPPTLHHLTQLSRGGPNANDNLVLLCHTCHQKAHQPPTTLALALAKALDVSNGKFASLDQRLADNEPPT